MSTAPRTHLKECECSVEPSGTRVDFSDLPTTNCSRESMRHSRDEARTLIDSTRAREQQQLSSRTLTDPRALTDGRLFSFHFTTTSGIWAAHVSMIIQLLSSVL
ncbi:hypothetical protein E2C01_062591 [Portunus trituberculatus]|uniref:Uncharacterized protein n=1 Tax=Portunus trituberculatus TaxID=210409 RepID=A0A5B7H6T2_PORTR|nr:hypothetical protein [Portunus trituberculatus]